MQRHTEVDRWLRWSQALERHCSNSCSKHAGVDCSVVEAFEPRLMCRSVQITVRLQTLRSSKRLSQDLFLCKINDGLIRQHAWFRYIMLFCFGHICMHHTKDISFCVTAPHGSIIQIIASSYMCFWVHLSRQDLLHLILCKRLALLLVLVALLFVFVFVLGNLWCSLRQ